MQALLGPLDDESNLRNAEVRAILMSVRFSTPFSLDILGKGLIVLFAWGLQMKRWKFDYSFTIALAPPTSAVT